MGNVGSRYSHNINMVMYGDCLKPEDWVHSFVVFAEQLQQRLGIGYSHFDCVYRTDEGGDLEVKSLKYIKRNMGRIHSLLTTMDIYGLGYVAAAGATDLTQDAACSLAFSSPDSRPGVSIPYYQFRLQVTPELLLPLTQEAELLDFFVSLLQEVDNLIDVRYGLVQPMDRRKRGGLYFADIFSEHLSQVERDNLHLWVRSRRQYRHKVREVYWGNLITDEHLGIHRGVVLNEISNIVRPNGIAEPSKGKYFFALPTDILVTSLEGEHVNQRCSNVREVLALYDLLMT